MVEKRTYINITLNTSISPVLKCFEEIKGVTSIDQEELLHFTVLCPSVLYTKIQLFPLMTLKEIWQIPLKVVNRSFWKKHIKCQGTFNLFTKFFITTSVSLVSSPRKPPGKNMKEKAAPRPLPRYCHFSSGWSAVSFSTTFELCMYFGSKSAPGEGKPPKSAALLHLLVPGVSTGWVPTVPIREKLFLQALFVNDLQWELLMALFITESCVVGHY